MEGGCYFRLSWSADATQQIFAKEFTHGQEAAAELGPEYARSARTPTALPYTYK